MKLFQRPPPLRLKSIFLAGTSEQTQDFAHRRLTTIISLA
jgi:hypothetical protein